MGVIVEIAIDPIGTNSPSVSNYIKVAIDVIRRSGYKYEVGPHGGDVN
ncbi:thiamine-binding protein [Vulcanisaeta souniana]|nr:thiamine-binding protein [Vulcanisaeta souniana]